MILATARIRLTPWRSEDWEELCPIVRDSRVMRYISEGQPWPNERIVRFIARQVACFHKRGYCLWKVVCRDTVLTIGFCGLQPLADSEEIDCSWSLAHSYWEQGFATEAVSETLRDGFERIGLSRIVSKAQPANRASIRVMEKVGMNFECETTQNGVKSMLYFMPRKARFQPD
jgi:ribosomal-protein-alanine N-acetyltransferase